MKTEMKIEYTFNELMNIVGRENKLSGEYDTTLTIEGEDKKKKYIFEFKEIKEDKKNGKTK